MSSGDDVDTSRSPSLTTKRKNANIAIMSSIPSRYFSPNVSKKP
ncbi:unnamed protein product [Amoebophrya sp. A120]|nr:unnamed protein product [Amoebophrya sp. A120]|eukprot:GSA120T00020557001.1